MKHTSPDEEIIVQGKVSGEDLSLRKPSQVLPWRKAFRYACRLEPSELSYTFFKDITLAGLGYNSWIDIALLMRVTSESHTKVPLQCLAHFGTAADIICAGLALFILLWLHLHWQLAERYLRGSQGKALEQISAGPAQPPPAGAQAGEDWAGNAQQAMRDCFDFPCNSLPSRISLMPKGFLPCAIQGIIQSGFVWGLFITEEGTSLSTEKAKTLGWDRGKEAQIHTH